MKLNEDQIKIFDKLIKFINDPNQKYINISGGAGTGKTYFISQIAENILKYVDDKNPIDKVKITATTNKAVAVIKKSIPNMATDIDTTHSFMNLRLKEDYRTGVTSVIPTPNWLVHSNLLLIIDECSMINKSLFSYIMRGLDKDCKIIFVGDKNQLAPVKESVSPIYINNYPILNLIKPVRNAEQPALMALCEQAKQTVLTGNFTRIVEVPGIIDFVDNDDKLKGYLERDYIEENKEKRIICYTNKKVMQYNDYIRQIRNYKNTYEVGEILCNNESYKGIDENSNKFKLYTDELIEIRRIVDEFESKSIIPDEKINLTSIDIKSLDNNYVRNVTCFSNSIEKNDVLKHYARLKNWERYFHIKNTFPDFRPITASTAHKAQGSTYDSVIVDLGDIGQCRNKEQMARMQYVALSRAKNRLFIRGALPDKYYK